MPDLTDRYVSAAEYSARVSAYFGEELPRITAAEVLAELPKRCGAGQQYTTFPNTISEEEENKLAGEGLFIIRNTVHSENRDGAPDLYIGFQVPLTEKAREKAMVISEKEWNGIGNDPAPTPPPIPERIKTLTGQPPLSFKSDGTPLISWSMKGNGSQQGTPTPNNPVMPTFCGVRTRNLFDKSQTTGILSGKYINQSGVFSTNQYYYVSYPIILTIGETYTWSFGSGVITHSAPTVGFYDSEDNLLSIATHNSSIAHFSFTVPEGCAYIRASVYKREPVHPFEPMLISGTVPQADNIPIPWYEPFGWEEKITCAGQTLPVYLGEVPTVRRVKKLVLTGEEQWQFFSDALGAWQFYINDISLGGVAQSSCMSNIAPYGATATTRQRYDYGCYLVTAGNGVGFQMKGAKDTFTGITSWKSYLAAQYAAGHPVTVWYVLATEQTAIVNEPLAKIGTYADELSSTDAAVTIPTVKGANTLTVDTDLQPSEVSITGHIKEE